MMGAGKVIKTARPETKIIATEPKKYTFSIVIGFEFL
jgi:cysteine synthase